MFFEFSRLVQFVCCTAILWNKMDDVTIIFTLTFLVFSFCFVFRTSEFVNAGVTVENLLGFINGRDFDNFVLFHIKRASYTLLIHSSLPLVYRLTLSWVTNYPIVEEGVTFLNIIGTVGFALFIASALTVYWWSKNNWENHPASQQLNRFFNLSTSWRTLATLISDAYIRAHKITIRCNTLVEVVFAYNWIIKIAPYGIDFAHQNYAKLSLDSAENYNIGIVSRGSAQYFNVKVSHRLREETRHFYFRINAVDFIKFQEKLNRPMDIAQGIDFYPSKIDQFLRVFREHVFQNPPYQATEELDLCNACDVNSANVKLVRTCLNDGPNPCGTCYCRRAMMCLNCMGRWFAARLEEVPTEEWLSSKCMCPGCRSVFCVLDISPITEMS